MIWFCERIGARISALVDGERLEREGLDQASVEAHVNACTYCAAERRRLERARDMVEATRLERTLEALPVEGEEGPPPRVWDAIEGTLRREGRVL